VQNSIEIRADIIIQHAKQCNIINQSVNKQILID